MIRRKMISRVLRNRNIMAAELAFAGFSIVEHGSWLAILLFAFEQGGVTEIGTVAFAMLVPTAILAPLAGAAADRLAPNRALAAGFGLQAITAGLTAVAIQLDASRLVVYLAAGLLAVAIGFSRPTMSGALPTIATAPTELATANSIAGFIETTGSVIGPGLAGAVLLVAPTQAVFAIAFVMQSIGCLAALTIRPKTQTYDDPPTPMLSDLVTGFDIVRREPAPRLLVILLSSVWVIFGALDVALVVIAVEELGRHEATAGLLASALGVGGIIGAGLSFGLVGRRRLSLAVAFGLVAASGPVIALAGVNSLVVGLLLLAVVGIGDAVADVAGRTLLQGLAAEDTLARVFGLLEGLSTAALALGSLGFSALAAVVGIDGALIALGAFLPLLLLASFGRLRAIDRARPTVDPDLLALVKTVPIFAPLPAFRLEQLLVNLDSRRYGPDATVFNKDDDGEHLYVVAEGSAVVELSGGDAVHHPGGFFGEIALVRNQPRMATVRAGADGLVAYALGRDVFLEAIGAYPRSRSRTVREIDRRLGD